MRAADITDEDSLRAWLETRPKADAVAIAHRAAMRVFPVWAAAMGEDWAHQRALSALPVFRAIMISGVSLSFQIEKTSVFGAAAIRAAATRAAAAAAAAAVDTDFGGAAYIGAAADAARSAAASYDADDATLFAAAAANFADALWDSVGSDAEALQAGLDCRQSPLWREAVPRILAIEEEAFLILWSQAPQKWDFWTRWWIGARDGKPLDWELQKRVALIPSKEWEKNDPAHIATLIRQIEDEFVRERTEKGEAIAVNPETGKLRLVPT